MKNKKIWIAVAATLLICLIAALYSRLDRGNAGGVVKNTEHAAHGGRQTEPADRIVEETGGNQTSKPWYEESFVDIRAKADRGDALAQRMLSEIYEDCFTYNLWGKEKFFQNQHANLKLVSADTQENKARLSKIYTTRCENVDQGQPIPHEAYVLWMEQSAKGGDIVAQLRMAQRKTGPIQPADLSSLVTRLKEDRGGNATFEMGNLLDKLQGQWQDEKTRSVFEDQYAAYAWQIAACRSGLDCGRDSRIMTGLCVNSGACNFSGFEQAVFQEAIPAGRRSAVEKNIKLIQENFLK